MATAQNPTRSNFYVSDMQAIRLAAIDSVSSKTGGTSNYKRYHYFYINSAAGDGAALVNSDEWDPITEEDPGPTLTLAEFVADLDKVINGGSQSLHLCCCEPEEEEPEPETEEDGDGATQL